MCMCVYVYGGLWGCGVCVCVYVYMYLYKYVWAFAYMYVRMGVFSGMYPWVCVLCVCMHVLQVRDYAKKYRELWKKGWPSSDYTQQQRELAGGNHILEKY